LGAVIPQFPEARRAARRRKNQTEGFASDSDPARRLREHQIAGDRLYAPATICAATEVLTAPSPGNSLSETLTVRWM
jgi:hypothetical protein